MKKINVEFIFEYLNMCLSRYPITRVAYLVHSNVKYAVRFAMISNTNHRHLITMMHPEGMMSLSVCARFYTVFVESVEFLESHGQAVITIITTKIIMIIKI